MTVVDLNQFSAQIGRLEKANNALTLQSQRMSPRHAHQHPVHVLYGGAHLFSEATFPKIARLAQDAFHFAAPDATALNKLVGANWTAEFTKDLFTRVSNKLTREPLEDYRVDFEDGYGVRSDEEEDLHAISAAVTMVRIVKADHTPRAMGIRIKPLSASGMRRSLRTLSLFITQFGAEGGKSSGLKFMIITLPKVTSPEQVTTLADILDSYEKQLHLGSGFFRIEIVIESPEAYLSIDGTIPLPSFVAAARGRCQSLHFGVYDFTSSLGIGSAGQAIDHLSCDFGRMWMQIVAGLAAGLGLSDGIISRLPMAPKENSQIALEAYQDTWRYNYQQMMRSLSLGFYQGWDLHPAQIPIRHVANHVFVLQEFDSAAARLKMFLERASQASHLGGMFDDRASVLGLLNFFERASVSGILSKSEIESRGVDLDAVKKSI
jgi:citrate lyase beta subunit